MAFARAVQVAVLGEHGLADSDDTKQLAPPCTPNPGRANLINNFRAAPFGALEKTVANVNQRVEINSVVSYDIPELSHLPARPLHVEFDFLDDVLSAVRRGGCDGRPRSTNAQRVKMQEEILYILRC